MSENRFRQIPVVKDKELVGIVTDRDIRSFLGGSLLEIRRQEKKAFHTKIGEIMTTEPISVSPDDDLQQAVELLIEEKMGGIPVGDETEGASGDCNLCGPIGLLSQLTAGRIETRRNYHVWETQFLTLER